MRIHFNAEVIKSIVLALNVNEYCISLHYFYLVESFLLTLDLLLLF